MLKKLNMKIKKNISLIKRYGLGGWAYGFWNSISDREIPRWLAVLFRNPDNGQIHLPTYDGSNQCVHPDVISFRDKMYIAYTPYPYAIDTYENPQIACWEKNGGWSLVKREPIVRPTDTKRYHYSDPFWFSFMGRLFLFYRLTDKETDKSLSTIFYVEVDGDKIGKEKRLTEYFDYEYISPFMVEYNSIFFFHIERNQPNKLFVRKISSLEDMISSITPIEQVKLVGFGDEEWIWHLGVSSAHNYNYKESNDGKFEGVVTLLRNGDYSYFYNSMCRLEYLDGQWILVKGEDIKEGVSHIKSSYKSCLCEMDGKKVAYISLVDEKSRHLIYPKLIREL